MTYNQLYYRLNLLDTARRLPGLGARALVEIIAIRAASAPAVADFETTRQSVAADTDDPSARESVIAEAAAAECKAPDRRLSSEAFAQLAEAVVAAPSDALRLPGYPGPVPAADWLETAYNVLTQQPQQEGGEP